MNIEILLLIFICLLLGKELYKETKRHKLLKHYEIVYCQDVPFLIEPPLWRCLCKRIFDIAVSFVVLLTILPVLSLILGIIIKLTSKGPVIFAQKRVGLYNRLFTCYKFRSMYDGVENKRAYENDPRVTKIGKFMRKTHLDEFPQFFNVFRGDMSIVGPRPFCNSYDFGEYQNSAEYFGRLTMKPGITGLVQINSGRTLSLKDYLKTDLKYITNLSLRKDLCIVFKTLKFQDVSY